METYNSIEVTRQLVKDGKISQEIAETIFPQLKESEDERIRKDCIKYLNWEYQHCSINEDKIKIEKCIAWLKKQGEQNPANSAKTCKDEPKFKVGDWVVNTITKEVEQVIELTGCEYICSGHLIISFNEQHLLKRWTIQDAKDGDVLVASDISIFLFKGVADGDCKHYIALTTDNTIKSNEGLEHYWETSKAVYPATEEQRDLLFQKMKEAGYEWDAEKKELKKIEQKLAWSDEDEKMIEFWNLYYEHKVGDMPNKDVVENLEKHRDWLRTLKDRYAWKPSGEQIKALEHVLLSYVGSWQPELQSLLNDLQKLKG